MALLTERLDPHFSLRTFGMAFAGFLTLFALPVVYFGATGKIETQPGISVIVPISSDNSVSLQSEGLRPDDKALQTPPAQQVTAIPANPADQAVDVIEDAVAGLHETTPYGLVPVIRATDKLTAFQAYRAPFTPAPGIQGTVSLVMVDFGLSKTLSGEALKIPGLTYAVNPYNASAQTWISQARQSGHEVWLTLPVQTAAYPAVDTGPNTLLADLKPEENEARLLKSLAVATGYVGLINPGASFDFAPVKNTLIARGLGVVDSGDTQFWIDNDLSPAALQAKLNQLSQTASHKGRAIAFFHPYPSVLKAVADWSAGLQKNSLQLAPLSAAVDVKK